MAKGQFGTVLRHIRLLLAAGPAGDLTDCQLLDRFRADRDEGAFAALVQRHGPMVHGVCLRALEDANDAEDAFQATFLVFAKKAGSIRKGDSVGGWLYGVAARIAARSRADAGRRRKHERLAAAMQTEASGPQALSPEVRPILDEEVSRLPEKYRLPIVLRYLQGKSHEQTAQELGCPPGTLSWRLSQAREILAKRLTRRGVALSATALGTLLAENTVTAAFPPALATAAVQAGLTFAAGQTCGVSSQAILLAEGAMKTMIVAKLKTAGVVLLAIGVLGGGLGVLHNRNGAKSEAAFAVPKETETQPEPVGGPVVDGLKLILTAERTQTVMNADGSNAEPVMLKWAFANVGKKPIKLDAYLLFAFHMSAELTPPNPADMRRTATVNPLQRLLPAPPKASDFIEIKPGQQWSYPGWWAFPTQHVPMSDGWFALTLLKPGDYRIKLTYRNSSSGDRLAGIIGLSPSEKLLAAGSWIGTLASNELVVKVKPAPAPRNTATKPEPVGGPVVNGLKLILTADKTQLTMKPDGWNAEPIKLKLAFTNAGQKEIQFAVPSWFSSMTLNLGRADKQKVTTLPLPQAGTPDLSRAKSICLLKPGQSFSMEQSFPTVDFTDYLLKAGSYRLKLTYDSKRYSRYNDANFNQQPIPADCWSGTLSSNELVLQVKPPPDSKVKKTFSVKGKLGTGPGTGPNGYWTRTTIRTGDGKLYVLNFGRPDDEQAKKLFHQAWNLSQQGPNETIEVIATGTMLGADRTMLLVKTFKAADAKEAKPDGKARKTYSVKGKLGVWRTLGPDGRR